MRRNRLRELLDAGEPSVGTHLMSSLPAVFEIAGHCGFDYVEFELEYSPFTLYDLENMGRAVDLFDHMSCVVKIDQQPRTFLASKILGAGLQNLLFADVRTADDARECVGAVRAEAPGSGGHHGVGSYRNIGYVVGPAGDEYVKMLDEAVVILMIEKKEAVENLDEILSVEGVDMVQFGPGDYSMSIGQAGQYDHPEVWRAYQHTVETAHKRGVAARAEISGIQHAERYLDLGIRHFMIGTDYFILYNWWKENSAALREIISNA